jgi:hypothetical protein
MGIDGRAGAPRAKFHHDIAFSAIKPGCKPMSCPSISFWLDSAIGLARLEICQVHGMAWGNPISLGN